MGYIGDGLKPELEVGDISTKDVTATGDVTISDKIIHSGDTNTAIRFAAADTVTVETAGSERVRFDSSGNLLVGTTDTNPSNNGASGDAGVAVGNSGYISAARSSESVGLFNRMDSDGTICLFRKDGTDVGSIGTSGGALFIGNDDAGIYFNDHGGGDLDSILPYDVGSGALYNGHVDIGGASNRFKNLYLSGGAYLGGTGSANYLDDYEEGTWTPAGYVNVDAIGSQSAFYTKIGNKVTVSFYANINPANNTQTIGLSGLPFTVTDKIVGTQVEATGVAFEDTSLFLIWAQGGTDRVIIEFDRPMEGSASTAAKDYRASITYFSD